MRATPPELRRIPARIRRNGPLTIRGIGDNELVERDHTSASRNPPKRALQREGSRRRIEEALARFEHFQFAR